MTLPKIDVGAIIGFKGCTVNKIRRLSGAQIVITGKREDKVNTVILKGRTKQVRKASEMIEKLLQDTVVKTLTLSTIDVGVIIGVEGCMVNKIQRMSGAKIDFYGSREDEVNTVVLKGRTNKVRKALEMIKKLLQDTVVARLALPYSLDTGPIIDEKGCRINELQRSTSTIIHVRRPGGKDNPRQIEVKGVREQVNKAVETIKQIIGVEEEFVIEKLVS